MVEAGRSERPPAAPAAVFGKYQLLASLGQGGMAEVFLAVVHGLVGFNKLVVVKRLRSSLAEEPEFLPMFLDEARLAARLNHPNVVQTNEVGEVDGEYFIAMEYLEGQPLNRILSRATRRKTPVPTPIFLHMLAEALAGLHHAHELKDFDGTPLNVVHRDATPHNIFVTYEGITKLVDFGIAKAATRSYETRTGVLKGKLQYMAPEQARCEDVDRRADVFSLGAVMWELLAGQRLWAGLTDLQVLEKLVTASPAAPRSVNPDVPEELDRICMKALARDVDGRHASAAELREELEVYIREHARCSAREVGEYVQSQFADKREQIRVIIERQLARAQSGGDPVDAKDALTLTFANDSLRRLNATSSHSAPPIGSPISGAPEGDGSGPRTASHPTRNGTPAGVAPFSTIPDDIPDVGSRSRKIWIAAALAGTIAIVLLAVRHRGDDPAAPQGSPASAAASSSQGMPPTDDVKAPAANTITVRVEAKPADARISIDDTPVAANPFEGRFPADGLHHHVTVEAKGHKTERRMVLFDQDVKSTFELTKGKDDDDRPRPAGPSRPYPPSPKPGPASQTTEPAPTPPPTPPPAPKGPGQPAKRPLEKGDPWGNP